jgi:hypothetical protein
MISAEGFVFVCAEQRDTAYDDTRLNIQVSREAADHIYEGVTKQDIHDRAVAVQAGMEALSEVRIILDVAAAAIECSKNGEQ